MSLTGVTVSELPELNRSDILMDDYIPVLDMHDGDLKKLRIGGTAIIQCVCDTPTSTANKTVSLYDISYNPQAGDIFQIQFTLGNDAENPTLEINGMGAHDIIFHGQPGNHGGILSQTVCNAFIRWNGTHYEMLATDALFETTNAAHASTADVAENAAHASTADFVLQAANASTASYAINTAHASTAEYAIDASRAEIAFTIPVDPLVTPTAPGSIWLQTV